jgi:hypothetical protein
MKDVPEHAFCGIVLLSRLPAQVSAQDQSVEPSSRILVNTMQHQPSTPENEKQGAEDNKELSLREANKRMRQGNQHFAAVLRGEMKELQVVRH